MNTDRVALEKALEHAEESWVWSSSNALVIEAARKHLATLPKPPRMVETYHVEFVFPERGEPDIYVFTDKASAEARAARQRDLGRKCVRVTGPHLHCVPAT